MADLDAFPEKPAVPGSWLLNAENLHGQTQQLYEPLCDWQTRLIELLPTEEGGPLQCNLHHADIITLPGLGLAHRRERVEYEAISYSWGHPDRTATILCNGVSTLVPPSLAEALRALRRSSEARWLWCDALCINQDDIQEKSAQVRKMLTIFFKASAVIAWLGPSNEATTQAFNLLRSARGSTSGVQDAITRLTERRWFSRTWVRQEVFAARRLTLQCGSDLLTSETFLNLATGGVLLPPLLEPVYGHTKKSHGPDWSFENLTSDFIGVLRAGAHFGATDPRDKVYALLGMVKGLGYTMDLLRPSSLGTARDTSHHRPFPIDYTRNVSQVYQDVIKYIINETGTLDCLSYFGPRERRGELPSWTLNWADRQDCERLYLHFGADLSGISLKGGQPYRQASSQISVDSNEICLHGHIIGLVGERPDEPEEHYFPWYGHESKWAWHDVENRNLADVYSELHQLLSGGDYVCVNILTHEGSEKSLVGVVVPSTARIGDTIALLDGSHLAFILRPLGTGNRYTLVGAAWFWNKTRPKDGPTRTTHHTLRFDDWATNTFKLLGTTQTMYRGYHRGYDHVFCYMLVNLEERRKKPLPVGKPETFFLV